MIIDVGNTGAIVNPSADSVDSKPAAGNQTLPAAAGTSAGNQAAGSVPSPEPSLPGDATAVQAVTPATQAQLVIESSIKILLEQLNTALQGRNDLLKQLPPEIRAQVEQLLQQTMPQGATIPDGLVSLLKSQSNTVEQLKVLLNTLYYLNTATDRAVTKLSDPVLNLFRQLEIAVSTDGAARPTQTDGAGLLKLAQQLLIEGKPQNPAASTLQQLWSNSILAETAKTGFHFGQLLKSFFTLPSSDGNAAGMVKNNAGLPAPASSEIPAAGTHPMDSQSGKQAAPDLLSTPGAKQSAPVLPGQQPAVKTPASVNTVNPERNLALEIPEAKESRQAGKAAVQLTAAERPAPGTAVNQAFLSETEAAKQLLKEFSQTILLVKPQHLSKEQRFALQQLLSTGGDSAAPGDLQTLARLLKASVETMPPVIRQAGEKIPELQHLWVLQQLSNTVQLTGLTGQSMDSAAKILEQLIFSFKGSLLPGSENLENHRTLSFTMPIYFADSQQSYPAYIHIYHQARDNGGAENGQVPETWLRICLETENAGPVDLIFCLYKGNKLNVRVGLADDQAVQLFHGFVPEIKTAIEATPLTVTEISVGTIGEK